MQFNTPTDPVAIRQLMEQVEEERKRNEAWAYAFRGEKYAEKYAFRGRRLGEIRENLRMLAESYED
jgi:hypothetical protein